MRTLSLKNQKNEIFSKGRVHELTPLEKSQFFHFLNFSIL